MYSERINIVTDYIDKHLDENLQLEQLAELASLSVFHFHRIARVILKQPITQYIIRLRVKTAAKLLRYSTKTISEIAYEVGFETPSSLSKRFKKHYHITPRQYRENLELFIISPVNIKIEQMIEPQKTIVLPDQQIAYIRLTGNFADMDYGSANKTLMEFAMKNELLNPATQHVGICYDDPHVTATGNCRYDLGITVNTTFTPEGKVGKKVLQGGKYAIFEHIGPYEKLDETYNAIYGKWLFESGFELRNVPNFSLFINSAYNTPPADLITHIYIPIAD